jgi:hypothetical protein
MKDNYVVKTRELIGKIKGIQQKVREYESQINGLLGIAADIPEPRHDCFHQVLNHLQLTNELLSFYYSRWSKPTTGTITAEREEDIRQENIERCIMISNWAFILSLSSIEYSAKASVAAYGSASPAANLAKTKRKTKYLYLSDIINNSKSKAHNLVDPNEYNDWQNLIFLRNCIVHNNGKADCDKSFDIAGIRVEAKADERMRVNIDHFAIFTEASIDRYFSWVRALINKYGK